MQGLYRTQYARVIAEGQHKAPTGSIWMVDVRGVFPGHDYASLRCVNQYGQSASLCFIPEPCVEYMTEEEWVTALRQTPTT